MSPTLAEIGLFLAERFGPVSDVSELQGGAWSSAHSFVADGRELVLRVGDHREDFAKEQIAATWHEPGLPVPEVLAIGEAFDRHYIVSQRHHGTKLADLDMSRVRDVTERLFDVLASMRRVTLPGSGFGIWQASNGDAPGATWSEFLCGLADRDELRLVGWRRKISSHAHATESFRLGCDALQAGASDLPDVRGLAHADLLLNHLVGPTDEITAVFDWGNALAGDPLYDVAWMTFCIPWFPAIDRQHVLRLARAHFPDDDIERLVPLYELHIALGSLQYLAFTEDWRAVEDAADRVDRLLAVTRR